MNMSLQHCTHICMRSRSHQDKLKCTHSVLSHGMVCRHHIAVTTSDSTSNNNIACLVVAVVSVIQEQLLQCPWTSFLPGSCHGQTQAWCVDFLWDQREGLSVKRNHGSSTCHTQARAQTTNLATETTKFCIQFKLTE